MLKAEQRFDPARRRFFSGRVGVSADVHRPPWAVLEGLFVERCTRCADCVARCPEGLLVKGSGGFPETDFRRGGCTFCGECVAACTVGALYAPELDVAAAWRSRARIGDDCLSIKGIVCRACGDACERHAILFRLMTGGRSQPVLDTDECTGCGSCLFVCPAGAVSFPVSEEHRVPCPT